ncbi:MAG: hypothetical protein V4508_04060 [Pseudomonadota bacterium]
MKRIDIKRMKRAVATIGDHTAMNALLRRSMQFGHKRLVLRRYLQAVQLGLLIDMDVLAYCGQVAAGMSTEKLAAIMHVPGTGDELESGQSSIDPTDRGVGQSLDQQ